MSVFLLLALIWAVILVPPAVRAHSERKHAFLLSFGAPADPIVPARTGLRSSAVQRRRRIAGGLLVAMAATLVVGLLPTFRALLIVHLFLVDSFLAYIGLLAQKAAGAARARAAAVAPPAVAPAPAPRRRPRSVPAPAFLAKLGPMVPLG